MVQIKDKTSVNFVISPYLNLFFHLERISGSVKQRFSKKYYKKFKNQLKEDVIDEFKWNFEPQVISWCIKEELAKINSRDNIKSAFQKGGNRFSSKIGDLFLKSLEKYTEYWKKEAEIKLKEFKNKVEKIEPEIKEIIQKINKITNIPWKSTNIEIYLIESLSEDYDPGAEPMGNGIAIGVIDDFELLKRIITHELIHLNIKNRIIKLIPSKHKKDENEINEAITDILVDRVLMKYEKPKTRGKMKFYIDLFWEDFNKKRKIKNLENFILKIFNSI